MYTRTDDSGVARFCLDWDSDLLSDGEDLQDSGSYGWVAFVSGEATAQNFSAENLERMYEEEKGKLEERYTRAVRVFEGKE